jgi:multiple sugar transport system substrate-binding protein
MNRKVISGIVIALAASIALSGCGGGSGKSADTVGADGKAGQQAKSNFSTEPVTLTVWNQSAGILNDDDLETFLGKPVRSKYPNISFQLVKDVKLDDMIASGDVPDLITSSNPYLYGLIDYKLAQNLNDMLKQESIDLKRFEPSVLDAMKLIGTDGGFYGMPFAMNYGITVYNKSIFDKFGVSYPKDKMTWEEMIELSKKITRTDGANEYIGLDPGAIQTLIQPRSLPVVDTKTNKPAINTEPIKQIFGILQNLYSTPGYVTDSGKKCAYGYNYFQQDKKLGMLTYWLAALTSRVPDLNTAGVDWDIVSYPNFADRPQYGRQVDFHLVVLTTTSKHKEAGYKALSALVTDEAQSAMNRSVRLTVLNNPAMRKDFASETKYFAGKNLSGIFQVNPAPLPPTSLYDSKMFSILNAGVAKMVRNKADINTVMREADEEAIKYIQEQKAQ